MTIEKTLRGCIYPLSSILKGWSMPERNIKIYLFWLHYGEKYRVAFIKAVQGKIKWTSCLTRQNQAWTPQLQNQRTGKANNGIVLYLLSWLQFKGLFKRLRAALSYSHSRDGNLRWKDDVFGLPSAHSKGLTMTAYKSPHSNSNLKHTTMTDSSFPNLWKVSSSNTLNLFSK